ncbi:P-loop NTPase fold protein [Actinomycetospora sp. TBRC 11914]|uniref:P-loop NTPase fold protein n=1 Tax=Actinomycetospora sp. TBRC 11914 TaxID=2729387 RepID=UPI00145EA11B|nr:P-loop NTPase fold protein [Actinomycetospora sp. TBRC 11914]NMO88211.1 hypothetical protein [Actinomycetospora sp. TBRC 11914]
MTKLKHFGALYWGAVGEVSAAQLVLAAGSREEPLRLWDPATSEMLAAPLHGIVASPWGAFGELGNAKLVLATPGRDDTTVQLWDPATGQAHGKPLTGHTGRVSWGVFGELSDGQVVLATGGDDTTVRLWDPATGQARRELAGHDGGVFWGVFVEIESQVVLATGGMDGTVRLWDSATGQARRELTGHNGGVLWGAFAELEGRAVLATGGGARDQTVRLWDPASGKAVGEPLWVHQGVVKWGAFAKLPDGSPVLVTIGDDGFLRVWELLYEKAVTRRRPIYRSDTVGGEDELRRGVEATALAELITSKSVRPPLAIGLFGDWGTGKSYFIDLIRREVAGAARRGGDLAFREVRQVGFNAWHYAETDLWASLVAQIFRQLANPTPDDSTAEAGSLDRETAQRRQFRLDADLLAQRGTVQELTAAENRLDDLRAVVRDERRTPWRKLPEEQQTELKGALGSIDAAKAYAVATSQMRWLRLLAFQLRELRRALRGRELVVAALATLIVAGLVVGVAALGPLLVQWAGRLLAVVGGGGLVAVVAASQDQIRGALKQVASATARARRFIEAQQSQLQSAIKTEEVRIAALKRKVQNFTAAGKLAGLVAERAAEGYYRRSLGLMTDIREDFEHMASLLAAAAEAPDQTSFGGEPQLAASSTNGERVQRSPLQDKAGDELPRIDRIVLYIDDLDRCPPARVVAMLEAVHLLLAVKGGLFVVVLAVDPRWLLRAVGAHYRDVLDHRDTAFAGAGVEQADEATLGAATPAQYLEKIFQLVFTLPSLRDPGYQSLIDSMIDLRDDTTQAPATSPQPSVGDSTRGSPDRARRQRRGPDQLMTGHQPVQLSAAQRVDKIDPFALSKDERDLMRLLGPPLIVTPRSVRRLANSYGLLAALRRLRDPTDEDPAVTLAAMVLLGALVGYPALGPQLVNRLHRNDSPSYTWSEFLAQAPPVPGRDPGTSDHVRASAETIPGGGPDGPSAAQGRASDPDQARTRRSGEAQSRWIQKVHDVADARVAALEREALDFTAAGEPAGLVLERSSSPADAMPAQWQEMTEALVSVTKRANKKGIQLPEDLEVWAAVVEDVARLSFPAGAVITQLASRTPTPDDGHRT